ncbi:MAG: DUF4290 domain-containing protein [Flavobacteriaceae bacterium]|nr:DUF4290 domain-containing protein [Flavobacteriaceae bacterium]
MEALQYNSERTPLIIPEYGRHMHIMVQQLLETEDKEERNKKAKAIIGVMGNLNPHLRDVPDFQHKLWDQLFIMSEFKLDVDSPFEKPEREVLEQRPEPLSYPQGFPKYRFYGNNIKSMIDVALKWEEGEMKDALVYNIANHMKKCFLNWNKDTVDDPVIFDHLTELSKGELKVKEEFLPLTLTQDVLRMKSKNGNGPKSNGSNKPRKNRNRKRY